MKFIFVLVTFLISLIFIQCGTPDTIDASKDTSALIKEEIIAKSCATVGCHSSEVDASFQEHGLLFKDWSALLNRTPRNITAAEAGLKLIMPFDAENSLLYQKLLFESTHKSDQNFGSIMPLGGDLLKKGQIEFIKRWIDAGAPEKGNVADVALLKDQSPSLAKFEPLAAPANGTGYQMKLEPFEVYPNFERELFSHRNLKNDKTILVNKFQIKMHPGSHHFILYGFRNEQSKPPLNTIRDLRFQNGSYDLSTFSSMSNHIFYFGGSESNYTFDFPAGTAVELPANMTFDMNSHYFNKGSKSYNGEVYINLYTTQADKVNRKLKVLDLGNTSFTLPAKQRVVVTKSFNFARDSKIVTLFSHTHKLGEKFEILIKGGPRNGELVYTSTNWEHPKKIDFANPISLKAGEGLTSRITYNNFTDQSVRFGLTSADEMGIIFGYYYED
jgi:Copper type II ascorbate-dependent monooxygenase, C-terminal domain